MKKFLFISILNFLTLDQCHAYFAREIEPGIVEMMANHDGSLVTNTTYVDKKKQWVYLEVKEGVNVRYFYAPFKDFSKISVKKRFKMVQFGIDHRIHNIKGKIPFGSQRYFYPLVDYKTAT